MDFPTTEPQIMALVYRMVSGYALHQADFPSIPFPVRIKLFNKGRDYLFARKALVETCAKLRIATKTKNEKLLELKNIMKKFLQKAQVDVTANPEKLKLIGWAPKDTPQPVELPGQPTNLQVIAKENGIICLKWDRPSGGGTIRNYIIERRGQIDNWQFAGISYHTQVNLVNQPLGVQIEYRVKAANYAGQSGPSNIVAAVL